MNDYFGNLAMRTLQPELGVQPRPRALFEGVVVPAQASLAHEMTEVVNPELPSAEPARASQNAGSSKWRMATPDEFAFEETIGPQPKAGRRGRTQPEFEAAVDAERISAPHPTVRAIAPSQGMTAEATNSALPVLISRNNRAEEAHIAPAIKPRVVAPVEMASAGERMNETTPSEPTIRIHIGRVDVRAVIQAAPSKPIQRETQRNIMSLDEYVRQRNGGSS